MKKNLLNLMKENKFRNFTPSVVFNYMCGLEFYRQFDGFSSLSKAATRLHRKLKNATGYTWDNENYVISDIYGKPVVAISFWEDSVSLYGITGSPQILKIINWEDLPKVIDSVVKNVSDGKYRCNECGKWVKKEKMKTYSFAGIVCSSCYDSKRHLPPDTRGD
jgi:hypothetical protein